MQQVTLYQILRILNLLLHATSNSESYSNSLTLTLSKCLLVDRLRFISKNRLW